MTVQVFTQAAYMAQVLAERQAGQEFQQATMVALPGPTHVRDAEGSWRLDAVAVPVEDLDTHPRSGAYRSALAVHRRRLEDLTE